MNWSITIVFIVILTALEVLAELALKPYSFKEGGFWSEELTTSIGILLYVTLAILLGDVLKRSGRGSKSKLGVINTTWQALNIVVVFSISFFVFKEEFDVLQFVGVIVAMLAAILMIIPELISS
jgi:multidrug transporter EmrE-like cation transporter